MAAFLVSEPFTHAHLGTFIRKHGDWIGAIDLPPHGKVELRLAGDRKAPSPAALELAADLPTQYAALASQVADALFEHYEPYSQDGLLDELVEPGDVWSYLHVTFVDIDPERRGFTVEIRMETQWDEEHTLGVQLKDGELVDLNGSVGP
jgi:hypothetical protein